MSDSRPISPPPVTNTAEKTPAAMVEETKPEDSSVKKKIRRPKKYDSSGRLITPTRTLGQSSRSTKRNKPLGICTGYPLTKVGGGGFTPHVFTVHCGEDIIGRIKSFTQNGSRGVCVLSAIGAVSSVKIQQLGYNNMVLNLEGEYEILSLSSSVVVNESGGVKNVTEAWRISVSGDNNRFFGGCLAGKLIAANPVQVVIGSFCPFIPNQYACTRPRIPNTLAFQSTGQVHQLEMRNPFPCSNREWYGPAP